MRCIYKKDRPLTSVCLGSAGLQLFLLLLLHLRGAFGWQQPGLATLQTEVFEKEADLGRTAVDASQCCEHRDCFVDRLRWMRPSLGFNSVPMRI